MKKNKKTQKALVRKKIIDDSAEQLSLPLPFIQKDEVPLFLRASRLLVFAATNKIIQKPLLVKEKYADGTEIKFTVGCAFIIKEIKGEAKHVNIGRLNDFDYRVWTIIKKKAMEVIDQPIFYFKVPITLNYIAKQLGYKRIGGSIVESIYKSIERLCECQTELYIKNSDEEEYLTNKGSYLAGYEFFKSRKKINKKYEAKYSYVLIGPFFAKEIKKSRLTKLNYNVFQHLKSPLARWLHHYLSSIKDNVKIIDLPYIRERSGQPEARVRHVEKAAEELIFGNFLETYNIQSVKKGRTKVAVFVFVKKETTIYPGYIKELDQVRKTDPFLYVIMKNLKMNYESAKQLLEKGFAGEEDNKLIKMLKLMKYYQLKGKIIKNPAGWVISGIRENRQGPKEFEDAWNENLADVLVPNRLFYL